MRGSFVAFLQAWRTLRWRVVLGVVGAVAFTALEYFTHRRYYGPESTIRLGTPLALLYIGGPVLAAIFAIAMCGPAALEPARTFWMSRPIPPLRLLALRLLVGVVALFVIFLPPLAMAAAVYMSTCPAHVNALEAYLETHGGPILAGIDLMLVVYAWAFFAMARMRKATDALLTTVIFGALVAFLPMFLPGLGRLDLFGLIARHTQVYYIDEPSIALSLGLPLGPVVVRWDMLLPIVVHLAIGATLFWFAVRAVGKERPWRLGLRGICWVFGAIGLLFLVGASRQLGNNMEPLSEGRQIGMERDQRIPLCLYGDADGAWAAQLEPPPGISKGSATRTDIAWRVAWYRSSAQEGQAAMLKPWFSQTPPLSKELLRVRHQNFHLHPDQSLGDRLVRGSAPRSPLYWLTVSRQLASVQSDGPESKIWYANILNRIVLVTLDPYSEDGRVLSSLDLTEHIATPSSPVGKRDPEIDQTGAQPTPRMVAFGKHLFIQVDPFINERSLQILDLDISEPQQPRLLQVLRIPQTSGVLQGLRPSPLREEKGLYFLTLPMIPGLTPEETLAVFAKLAEPRSHYQKWAFDGGRVAVAGGPGSLGDLAVYHCTGVGQDPESPDTLRAAFRLEAEYRYPAVRRLFHNATLQLLLDGNGLWELYDGELSETAIAFYEIVPGRERMVRRGHFVRPRSLILQLTPLGDGRILTLGERTYELAPPGD